MKAAKTGFERPNKTPKPKFEMSDFMRLMAMKEQEARQNAKYERRRDSAFVYEVRSRDMS